MKVFPIDSDISCGCTPPQPQRQKRTRKEAIKQQGSDHDVLAEAIMLEDSDNDADPTDSQDAQPKSSKASANGPQHASRRRQRRTAIILDAGSDEDFQPEQRTAGSRKSRKAAAKGSPQSAAAAQHQEGSSTPPRRRQPTRKPRSAGDATPGAPTDFFMPLAQRKQKKAADRVAAERAAAEAAAQAALERDAQEQAEAEEARRQAAKAAAVTFQQDLKRSAEDTARINAGRVPHAFFDRRAAADAGAARVKLVTELTEPPMPPIHITQVGEAAAAHSIQETRTFRYEAAPAEAPAAEEHAAAAVSFALVSRQATATASPNTAAPAAEAQPAGQSLLQQLAQQLADAERPSASSSNAELEDRPTAEQHLQRLQQRLAQVSAARDGATRDPGLAAAEPGAAPPPPPSATHALWTERFQPRQPSQVCGNADAVEELRSWLGAWQENAAGAADLTQPRRPPRRSHARALLSDSDWSAGEGDADSDDDARAPAVDRGNAVLLSGPVGSGKTAAAYAVAVAAGYRVIEVNPSVNRAGAQVQRLVGEATQSQRVALAPMGAADGGAAADDGAGGGAAAAAAADVPAKPAKKAPVSSFFRPQQASTRAGKQLDGTGGQLGKSNGAVAGSKKGGGSSVLQTPAAGAGTAPANGQVQPQGCGQPPPLTLLLFEEVENLQDEDRGFISTLQTLLTCSKCPIIMTSNHSSPGGMLSGMQARVISFARPSPSEVLQQLVLLHEADGAPSTPLQHLAHLAAACRGDLRQSIHMAQALRGCAHPGPFAAAAAPADDRAPPAAEDLDRRMPSLLQGDLQPAEQLRMVVFASAADTVHHRLGGTRRHRGSELSSGAVAAGPLSSWTLEQSRYGDACAAWVAAADDALNDSVRAHVSHVCDARYERLAALRSIAAVQRVLSGTGGGGRTRGRGHRNYFEGSLSLATSVAVELTNTCPTLGGNSSV